MCVTRYDRIVSASLRRKMRHFFFVGFQSIGGWFWKYNRISIFSEAFFQCNRKNYDYIVLRQQIISSNTYKTIYTAVQGSVISIPTWVLLNNCSIDIFDVCTRITYSGQLVQWHSPSIVHSRRIPYHSIY